MVDWSVATVLTVYGIETQPKIAENDGKFVAALQQYLPFTVLKHAACSLYRFRTSY